MNAAQQTDGVTAGVDASGGVLAELEAQLRAPDSILEPTVLELLKEYLRAGGKPQSAIEDLSENYAGYAQMCDVMCQWLEIADVRSASNQSNALSARPNSSSITPAAQTADGDVPDEFTILQELAKERFDATKFLGVFRRGHPEWLNTLIQDRRGRQLIYELSATHRNSLLLNYAIQRILKQGHEDEVSMVGGSLASYFEVYHRLLATRLVAVAKATSRDQLQKFAAEISESCVGSQHTYVHAQQLLTAAAAWEGGAVFRRLSQEVEAAAVAKHGGAKVYQLQPLFAPASAGPEHLQADQMVSDILVKSAAGLPGSAQLPSPGAAQQLAAVREQLQQLQQLYQQQDHLSVEPLRHPRLMELLLSGMFAAPKPVIDAHSKGDLRAVAIQLLALAVAGRGPQDRLRQSSPAAAAAAAAMQARGNSGGGLQQQQQQSMDEQLPDEALAPAVNGALANARGDSPEVMQQQQQQQQQWHSAAEVAQLLQQAWELSKKVSAPAKLKPADLELATQVAKEPVAALGLLQRSQVLLSDESAYADEKMPIVLPNHLSLLHRVACQQPSLIPEVLVVLKAVLTALGSNKQELSKSALNFLVSLIVSGAADAALKAAHEWASTADPSLVRHFIQLVLDSVEPPYSDTFARIMLKIMQYGLITRMKITHREMLQEFARGCSEVMFLPALTDKEQQFISELQRP